MSKELQQAYEDYIKHLSDYISGLASYLHVHGMGASHEEYERGKLLREKIEELKVKGH